MKLTIAIPTYNRPEKVLNTVRTLLPLLNSETCVLVMDNCSNIRIDEHLRTHIGEIPSSKLIVERNFVNIGADANFMRCFEYCKTPYIWILADDGLIEPDAIESIFSELEAHPGDDVVGFNFGSNYTNRTDTQVVANIDEFLERIDNFENFLFISTSVYNRAEYIKNIRYGYWGAYSMASQNVPCLVSLCNGKRLIISKYNIVKNLVDDRSEKWSDAQQALALSSILEAPLNLTGIQYKKLGKFLFRNIETFPRLFCDIILAVSFDVSKIDNYHKYIYKKIYKTTIEFRQSKVKQFFLYKIFYLLLCFKPLLKLVLNTSFMKNYVSTSSKFIIFNR